MRTLCYEKVLKKIVKRSKMLEREQYLGEILAQLLVYDVLFGMGVRGKFKVDLFRLFFEILFVRLKGICKNKKGTIKRNFESLNSALEYYMKKHQVEKREDLLKIFEDLNESSKIKKPKYVYLNTLELSKKEILSQLNEDGFVKIKKSELRQRVINEHGETESDCELKQMLDKMEDFEFFKDEHVKKMIIFRSDASINKSYHLFKSGHLMQIDKSSCLVPLALSPPEDAHCVDAASAPVYFIFPLIFSLIFLRYLTSKIG